MKNDIHGMIHCTGGGQTKVLKFVEKLHVVKDSMFDVPPLFNLLRESSGTSWEEMYRVFNMGHRMEIYLDKKNAQKVIDIAGEFELEAKIIGHCEAADKTSMTISTNQGIFDY